MKSGFSFNLKDMDAETRTAISEAARISGLTVADWLKRVMAERDGNGSAAVAGDAQAAAELARSMQTLTGRIAAMDATARAAISALPGRLDAIEEHIARLSAPGRAGSDRTRLLQETAIMVSDLAREIDDADERARSMIEGLPGRPALHTNAERDPLTDVINDLDRRIATMQHRVAPEPAPQRLSLDEIQNRLNTLLDEPAARAPSPPPARSRAAPKVAASPTAAIDATLRALEERIDEAKTRLDRAAAIAENQPPAATIEHIQRIEQRLADIAERLMAAEADRRKPNKELEIANAVREIAAHQKSLDEQAETAAMRRDQQAIAAAVGALRADLATLTDQVSAITRIGQEGHGAVFEVAHRLDTLAAERPFDRNMLESMRDEIERMRALVEVGARQDTLGILDARSEGISAQLKDLLRTVADRTRLDALGEEVAGLRRQLESDDNPRAVQRLEMHVSELGRSIDAALSSRHVAPMVERLEHRLEALGDRIDLIGDPGARVDAALRTMGEQLDDRLNDISARLGGLIETAPQTVDMEAAQQRFEASIAALGDRFGHIVEKATRPQAAAIEAVERKLDTRLEDIAERLSGVADNAQERAAIQHVHTRLQAITERIDRLNATQKERSPALDAIKSEIGALRKEVVNGRMPPAELDSIRGEIASLRGQVAARGPATDTGRLERQVQQLARQLDAVSTSKDADEPALAALEAQVARLAAELQHSKPQALHHVEETLDRVQAALADVQHESIATARSEARKAVAELSHIAATGDADSALIKGLMRDLDSLKSAATGSEVATQVRLESVSETMNHVVERLNRLETEGTADTIPTAATATAAPEVRTTPRHSHDWRATFDTVADTPEPVVAAASSPANDTPAVQIDFKAAQRRAEFIAAARRAANAVAEEAARTKVTGAASDIADDEVPGEEDRPGAFTRLSRAIRSRRRPLLLAAAAIVLAIGTVQLYGKYAPTINRSSLMTTARALLSGKVQDRLLTAVRAPLAAKPAVTPVAAPAPASDTSSGPIRQILDTTAAATAPQPVPDALIPPSSGPTRQITFSQPDTSVGHFSDDANTASLASTPAAPKATPLPITNPGGAAVILTSASTATPVADTGIDSPIGPAKLITAAGAGDSNAEFEVATRYAEGVNVPANLAKAAVWYEKSAEGGNAVAQYRLASLYERGQGLGKDLVSAVNWYQRAADQGNVNAMHNLAVLLSEGADGAPDHGKALQWFLAAANYGVRDSQYNLGVIYARGLGTAQDLGQSYKWFAIAAAQGDTDSAARRDEVAKAMSADDLTKARAAVAAWRAKTPLVEANAIAKSNWDDASSGGITVADQRALVAKIQTLLADAGYDPGPADGRMGPKTVDAVRAYQQRIGMPVTGQIDKVLVASLSGPDN